MLQTTNRQTTDRRTDGRTTTYSEREREFTFTKNYLTDLIYATSIKRA